MLILYAALRAIPSELYEAAAVDGASAVGTARDIKLPLLRPALLLCTIFSIIGTFQLFAEPTSLTRWRRSASTRRTRRTSTRTTSRSPASAYDYAAALRS